MNAPTAPPGGVASPCVNLCRMDAASGWCAGCMRSIDEIVAWSRLDDAGKRAVWARLPLRRIEFERQAPGARVAR
jgi:predicted Fe-S protein YdhL (DUF1289 family)